MPMTSPIHPAGRPLAEDDLARVVDRFYEAVRRHPRLGPVFDAAVHDWPGHKATLVRFWSSVALGTASYRGNPMALHRAHPIHAGHFADWLALWSETVHAELDADHADRLVDHAQRIGRSLIYGLGLDSARRPLGLPIAGG
jgi:hemoglobin